MKHYRLPVRVAKAFILTVVLSFCLSCASLSPFHSPPAPEKSTVLGVQHSYSRKPSDCLEVCVGMVLQYYGVTMTVPDTVLPLDLVSVSRRLNTATPVDDQGHALFATVLEMTSEELMRQLALERPLIIAFKPSAREEYHSVVLSGYSVANGKYYINDPARHHPHWKKLTKIRTFKDTGKYLVLLIGLREP